MRGRAVAVLLLTILAAAPSGCGGKFDLPTEHPGRIVPSNQSYGMLKTWRGVDGIQDLILTQGQGNQLFAVFNHGGSGGPQVARGEVRLYALSGQLDPANDHPTPITGGYFEPPRQLFNPIAIAGGSNHLYVLDQGDSCMAKFDARRGTCEPDPEVTPASDSTTFPRHPFRNQVFDYLATWRVREYGLGGGDTLSTFTDTTVSQPSGISADDQGRVYVAGLVTVLDTLQTDQRIRTRKLVSRVYRYSRGPKYRAGDVGLDHDSLDVNMPGTSAWHRDTTWVVFDGTGASSVADPRGIYWSPRGTHPLFIADRGNNQAKGVSTNEVAVSVVRVDGSASGANLNHPESVTADLAGFFYICDRDSRRVLRYDLSGEFIQRVDIEPNVDGQPLLDPTSVAVDDSLAYVADRGRGQIVRYKRRP